MHNIPKIHLGRNMCVHPFFRIFFFCLFERAEGSTRAVIVLSDLYLYPYFSIFQDFRSLDLIEQCMMHSSFIFLSFFFYVRCFVQLNRATFNRPVATPLAFFQFLLRGVQCIFFSSSFSIPAVVVLSGGSAASWVDYTYDAKRHARLARSNPLFNSFTSAFYFTVVIGYSLFSPIKQKWVLFLKWSSLICLIPGVL